MNIISIWAYKLFFNSVLVLTFFVVASNAFAQSKFALEPRVGFGTFRMKAMKEFQNTLQSSLPVPTKVTDNFPPFFQFGLRGSFSVNENLQIGLIAEMGSTGGRLHYADYSGHIQSDQILTFKAIGAFVQSKSTSDGFPFLYGAELSYLNSDFNLDSEIQVYDEKQTDEGKFVTLGISVKPYIGVSYLYKRLEGKATIGYLYNKSQPFHLPDDPKAIVYRNNRGDELEPDWSGLRLNFSVAFNF